MCSKMHRQWNTKMLPSQLQYAASFNLQQLNVANIKLYVKCVDRKRSRIYLFYVLTLGNSPDKLA